MSHTVVLHVGTMKSGTSFIQDTLGGNRDVLRGQGFLFPGDRWRQQVLGVIDVLSQTRHGQPVPGARGAWGRLVEEMADFDGTSVVSMEFLGPTPPPDIQRTVATLAPAKVKVVVTLRDLGRNIPAMWQEEIKNRDAWQWEDFLDQIRRGNTDERGPARKFWRQMRYPVICKRWADVVGRENLTVVTVPHPGARRSLLWERFCSVVGLDPTGFDLSDRGNVSLPAASAQVIRALNARFAEGGLPKQYDHVVKHTLAKRGMVTRRDVEQPIGFDPPGWVHRRARAQIARLARLGVPVVGDLAELKPVSTPGADPAVVPVEEQLDAAVAALDFLVRAWPTRRS